MEDYDLLLPSIQEFNLLSQNALLTTRLSAIFIFIYMFLNHATVKESIQDKAVQKANKQKRSEVLYLPVYLTEMSPWKYVQGSVHKPWSLWTPHKISKVYVEDH